MKPAFKPQTHEKYNRLIEAAVAAGPVVTAVAHPCDEASLKGAIEAARLGLITPVLIGPVARIKDVAVRHGIDIGGFRTVDLLHSHDFSGQGRRTCAQRRSRGLDEGQPAH